MINYENLLIKLSDAIKIRGLSSKTHKAYLFHTSKFLKFIKENSFNL